MSEVHMEQQLTVMCLHAAILAKPFLMANSNEAAAADALTDLLKVCLGRKQPHLQALLANIIAAVNTGTTAAAAAASTAPSSVTAKAPDTAAAAAGPASVVPSGEPAEAPDKAASEAAVCMLAAVADRLSPDWGDEPRLTGRKQQHDRVSKNSKMDVRQQQESAVHVMLAYASRGAQEQQMLLPPYLCKVMFTFSLCPLCGVHVIRPCLLSALFCTCAWSLSYDRL